MLTEVKQCGCEGTNHTSLIVADAQQQQLGRHIQRKMAVVFLVLKRLHKSDGIILPATQTPV